MAWTGWKKTHICSMESNEIYWDFFYWGRFIDHDSIALTPSIRNSFYLNGHSIWFHSFLEFAPALHINWSTFAVMNKIFECFYYIKNVIYLLHRKFNQRIDVWLLLKYILFLQKLFASIKRTAVFARNAKTIVNLIFRPYKTKHSQQLTTLNINDFSATPLHNHFLPYKN